jgi:glycosyltransferase involved in cell wall biosynthesis
MRILSITAGAAGMYCGSCARDNALAAALRAQGHDVVLLPLYTPTRTDEENQSEDRVFFGGISVYLEQNLPLYRRLPPLFDKLFDQPWLIRAASARQLSTDPKLLGELTISMLRGRHGFQSKEFDKLVAWIRAQPPFDVVNLPNVLLIGLAEPLAEALGCPIVCTLQGEDLFLEGLDERRRAESLRLIRAHAPHVAAFLAVSGYYAAFMSDYLGIPPEKIEVAPLGISLEGHDAGSRPAPPVFTVGYFARIAPEKGLHVLADAYRRARLEGGLTAARLEVAGYLAPEHASYLAQIEEEMRDRGLGSEFRCHGTLDRAAKIRFLRSVSVLSVPTTYVEPKGLFLLEAWANGVPVVQPAHGAFPEMIAKTGGGALFPPGNAAALADALTALAREPARAAELGRSGAQGVRRDYSAARMAARVAEIYAGVLAAKPAPPAREQLAQR